MCTFTLAPPPQLEDVIRRPVPQPAPVSLAVLRLRGLVNSYGPVVRKALGANVGDVETALVALLAFLITPIVSVPFRPREPYDFFIASSLLKSLDFLSKKMLKRLAEFKKK